MRNKVDAFDRLNLPVFCILSSSRICVNLFLTFIFRSFFLARKLPYAIFRDFSGNWKWTVKFVKVKSYRKVLTIKRRETNERNDSSTSKENMKRKSKKDIIFRGRLGDGTWAAKRRTALDKNRIKVEHERIEWQILDLKIANSANFLSPKLIFSDAVHLLANLSNNGSLSSESLPRLQSDCRV